MNTEGSYSCQCRPGLSGDGGNCTGVYNILTEAGLTSPCS